MLLGVWLFFSFFIFFLFFFGMERLSTHNSVVTCPAEAIEPQENEVSRGHVFRGRGSPRTSSTSEASLVAQVTKMPVEKA